MNAFNLYQYSKLENLKTLEMFDTFGLEDKITRSFIRHYQEFIKNLDTKKAEKEFRKNKSLFIGSSSLGNSIDPIIEKYGKPKGMQFPNKIYFMLMNRNHPAISGGIAKAFFWYNNEKFIIGTVLDSSIFDFNISKEFIDDIEHEIQHFLMSIYTDTPAPKYITNAPKNLNLRRYYGDDWEVHAYSTNIASIALKTISDLYNFRITKMRKDPRNALNILNKIEQNKPNYIITYIYAELKNFINKVEKEKKEKFPDDLKQKYYLATVNNFKNLFDKWIESQRSQLTKIK